MGFSKGDELCVNSIRMLAVDMVEAAKSGHPGLPLGAAPMAYVLWSRFLKFNSKNPSWPDRDRFVLSAGHGSAMLYALLHLFGFNYSIDDLKRFRQLDSKTPGHPERDISLGVEVTTGPLGQGLSMAVGMAMAERFLAARFNKKRDRIVDHKTFALISDGDLMEGVSGEAASFAGNQKLNKLVCLYDDNKISIEGSTELAFTENVEKRFEAYGWKVMKVRDGNNLAMISRALKKACRSKDKPVLIIVRTHIGFGSPKVDNAEAHGSPLGADAITATKKYFKWPKETFFVPEKARERFQKIQLKGVKASSKWQKNFETYIKKYPELSRTFGSEISDALAVNWEEIFPNFDTAKPIATRAASGKVINAIAKVLPNFLGGSADLAPSNNTHIEGENSQSIKTPSGRNIHFGVREHAMGAITNGMSAHGGVRPYCATFLVFSDYMRPAIRLAAIMNLKSVFVFTHDSIGVGEDGPTHEPVEHVASLRAIPNLCVIRPADANETAVAWRLALERNGPTALILSRQNLPVLDVNKYPVRGGAMRGGYVLLEHEDPKAIVIATGSEVSLALGAAENLKNNDVNVRVVSMPSCEIFDEQPEEYRERVLPAHIKKRITVEAGIAAGLSKYLQGEGRAVSIETFGKSAPIKDVMHHFGFTQADLEKIISEI